MKREYKIELCKKYRKKIRREYLFQFNRYKFLNQRKDLFNVVSKFRR